MERYNITKVNSKTEEEVKYGVYGKDDMVLITRGYKQDKDIPNLYMRKNSKWFFIVDIVEGVV